MGHTNSTPNIGLPQFIGTDKPTWLGDVNGAMSTIDTKIGSIDADIATTDAKADNAVADAAGAVNTATNAATTAGNASTTATQANNLATQALTVANNTADLCSDQIVPDVAANKTAIGTLADLQTTAKDNLVNAINEVAQGGGGGSVGAWTLAGTETGTTHVALPAEFNELCLIVAKAGGLGICYSWVIPATELSATAKGFRAGQYKTSNNFEYCSVYATDTEAYIDECGGNSGDVTNTSVIRVYYR